MHKNVLAKRLRQKINTAKKDKIKYVNQGK